MRQLHAEEHYELFDSLNIGGHDLSELRYADDTVLLSTTPEGLERLILSVKENSENQNLFLNTKKTNIMKTDKSSQYPDIKINDESIEVVNEFQYLGTLLSHNGNILREVKRRCSMVIQKLKKMKKVWQGTSITTRIKLLRSCIFPIATYGCEAWTMKKALEKIINSFEIKCYRKILKIPWIHKKNKRINLKTDRNQKRVASEHRKKEKAGLFWTY